MANKTKRKRLILVVVEGGCVQEVTHSVNEEWDVWDCDDFRDDPLNYFESRDEQTMKHLRKQWPELYADIWARCKEAQAEAAEDAVTENERT